MHLNLRKVRMKCGLYLFLLSFPRRFLSSSILCQLIQLLFFLLQQHLFPLNLLLQRPNQSQIRHQTRLHFSLLLPHQTTQKGKYVLINDSFEIEVAILGPGWKGDFFKLNRYSVDCVFNHSLCCCPSIFILDCHEDGSTVSTIRGTMGLGGSCLSMSRRTAIAA